MTIMSSAYSSKNLHFKTDDLTSILKVDSQEVTEKLCQTTGQKVAEQGVSFNKSSFTRPEKVRNY